MEADEGGNGTLTGRFVLKAFYDDSLVREFEGHNGGIIRKRGPLAFSVLLQSIGQVGEETIRAVANAYLRGDEIEVDFRLPVAEPVNRRGFTLVELLVVIVIILIVSAATLPTVLVAMRERSVVSAATLLQASLAGARDAAIGANAPRGIRLVPDRVTWLADGTVDPSVQLVSSRIVPLAIPPAYQEGRVSIVSTAFYPPSITGGRPCLAIESSPGRWEPTGTGYAWVPNPPTSWPWNVRIGEKVVIGVGREYTVCGPMVVAPGDGNPEGFINYGPPDVASALTRTLTSPDGASSVDVGIEVLLLVNGHDDNGDGYTDSGWDGLDNDGDGTTDELGEWETETWVGVQTATVADSPYKIRRRPVPASGGQPIDLASPAVVDLTGWGGTSERSRCVVDRYSGAVDLMIGQAGAFAYDLPYSGTSAIGMDRASFVHLWIGSRADVVEPVSPMPAPKEDARLVTITRQGLVSVLDVNPDDPNQAHLDARRGMR